MTRLLGARPHRSAVACQCSIHGPGPSQDDPGPSRGPRWPRLCDAPPLSHRAYHRSTWLLRLCWPAEGHTNEVDSSSLASFTSPLYQLTTPAPREEQGTSLYLRYNIPPHAPRAGSAKEATSGVFAGPAWPEFTSPAAASLGAIPTRPPVAARAAGEAAGRNGIENSMDLNVPDYDSAATSQRL